jgi:hypothetical protein
MKPFILAFGQKTITELIEPYLDRIVDGFKSTEELVGLVLGTACGELRHEGIL